MEQNTGTNDSGFDLLFMVRNLERRAVNRFRRIGGCIKPEECGHDIAVDLAHSKNCRILGDRIWLNFPQAIVQEALLYTSLRNAVLNRKMRCKDCQPGVVTISDHEPDDQDRRSCAATPIEPATPESILQEKEVLDRVLAHIPDRQRRAAFKAHVLFGFTHEEIALWLRVKPARVRKWYSRDSALLKEKFPNVESLWAK